MAKRIEEETFLVKTQAESHWNGNTVKTHIWLQVLEGEDQGMRLSIPLYSETYTKELEDTISDLSTDELVTVSLQKENSEEPWKITEIHDRKQF